MSQEGVRRCLGTVAAVVVLALSPSVGIGTPSTTHVAPGYRLLWSRTVPRMRQSPILSDGRVFVQSVAGEVQAFDAGTGKPLWSLDLGARLAPRSGATRAEVIPGPPPVCTMGTVFASASSLGEGRLYALNARTGAVRWQYVSPFSPTTRGPVLSSPAVWRDRLIVRTHGGLTALRLADGEELWNVEYDSTAVHRATVTGQPVVAGGVIYVGADYGVAYAFDAGSGRELWRAGTLGRTSTRLGNVVRTTVAINNCAPLVLTDRLITADGKGYVSALRLTDGLPLWRCSPGFAWQLCAAGGLLLAATDRGLVQIDARDGRVQREHLLRGGAWHCAIAGKRAIVGGDAWASPGWEVFDLQAWRSLWQDARSPVAYGLALSDHVVVLGEAAGRSGAPPEGNSARLAAYTPAVRSGAVHVGSSRRSGAAGLARRSPGPAIGSK